MSKNLWPQYSDKLCGTWKCISFEMYNGTGSDKELIAKPHGDNPLGRTQLSKSGFLSSHMAYPDRMKPLASGKTWQEADDAEVAHVAKGCSMYCGYLELFEDDEGLWWQTKVEISDDPNRVGGYQVRRVKYEEEGGKQYMMLQPKNDMVLEDGTRTKGVLKWVKID